MKLGDQSWMFTGSTDAKAETPVLWPPHVKSWLIGKDSDSGRDWGQEEKGTTKDEMAGWHHRLNGRESEWTPGVGDEQGGLVCCNLWGHKESHDWATEVKLKQNILKNLTTSKRFSTRSPLWLQCLGNCSQSRTLPSITYSLNTLKCL